MMKNLVNDRRKTEIENRKAAPAKSLTCGAIKPDDTTRISD